MSYNTDHLRTAGKITVYTSLIGVLVFAVVFIFNLGTAEIKQAGAQSQQATTSVTVVNTPPYFVLEAIEDPGSTTSSPTNVGDSVTWAAVAEDSNAADYYLLICDDNASPTPNSGSAPTCDPGAVQWAVSSLASSSAIATAATTTTANAPFSGESFDWYAWVCDDDAVDPKCSATSTQGRFGATATSSSPFEVNHRPTFTAFTDTSPGDPGAVIFFYSTSTDADVAGTADRVQLFVCSTNAFDSVNDTCSVTTLASTTVFVAADASSTYSIPIPLPDTDYEAYGFIIDEHGFEATGGSQGTDSVLTVNNVAPTVPTTSIFINEGSLISLSEAASQTPGFTLSFLADDNNTCTTAASTTEITSFALSLYRNGTGNSSTTCTTALGDYDPNNCYPSGATSTGAWNLVCTASSTSCTTNTDTDILFECTFPLWYIADATVPGSFYATDDWRAQVQAIDDDGVSGQLFETDVDNAVELDMLQAFTLNTPSIPYGSLEPGDQTDPLVATTTIASTGNVGLDKTASGTSMCTTYSGPTPCQNSASSTIPASEQVFATSTVAYASAIGSLSSTTGQEIEINVPKSTATSTPATADAFWGIRIPGTISFAGDYTGENIFFAVTGETDEW